MTSSGLFTISRFTLDHIDTLLSWIQTPEDKVLWSGNSFISGLNRYLFKEHLCRKDLFAFQLLNQEKDIQAYGEIVLKAIDQATLCRIIVNPENRGKGIGKYLCKKLISEIKEWKVIKEVSLNTLSCNYVALSCYESLGFSQQGVRKKSRRIGSDWHDLIFMSLKLT